MAPSPPRPLDLVSSEEEDALGAIPAYPAKVTSEQLPASLASNPLVQLYLQLSPQEEAVLAGLAASDATEDEQVAQALVASVR